VMLLSGCGSGSSADSKTLSDGSSSGKTSSPSASEEFHDTSGSIAPIGEEYMTSIEVSKNADGVTQAVRYVFAMDTEMMLEAFGENAEAGVEAASEEVLRIDQLLSVGIGTSDICRLNQEGTAEVSEDTRELICRGIEVGGSVGGAFDITVYPLMEAWGFTKGTYRVPEDAEIEELLTKMGADKVTVDGNTVRLSEGTKIDLGGIAKGYTSGRLMKIFASYGMDAALVSLGGNIQTYGKKTNGGDWRIGIQEPEKSDKYLGILSCHDMAVITSGGYERFFEKDGVTYHHILDPANGRPANAGLRSVTVVSRDGALADALSTSLYVLGPEKAAAYWKEHSGDFGFILEKDDGTLLVTENLADSFTTERTMEVVAGKKGIAEENVL
ncbi:MAG: FAD:protein FMN transferase, partial [bacterium]